MKILFVVYDIDYHSPLGLMQIAAMARQRGDVVYLSVLSRESILERVASLRPDVVAYGGSTGEHKHYTAINRQIKERFPEIITIMGGPHATFFPECRQEAALDALVIGEGEYAFRDILDRVERQESFSGVQNVFSADPAPVTLRPLVQDLDSLPFPDRALFYDNSENGQSPIKHFMATRGCPYNCSYCFNKSFRGMYPGEKYVRRHSVDYVIEEILATKARYPLQFVKFYDDIFVHRVDAWLEEFVSKYKQKVNLPFYCLTRADLILKDPEIARLLREAGCQTIQMAVESTNDRIRNELLQRDMSKEQIKQAFRICLDQGMTIVTNYILGLPTSTIEDDIEAVYFNIEAGAQVCEFPIFQPYPRTELGRYCLQEKLFDGNFEALHTSYNNRSPLNCFSENDKDIQGNINRLGQMASSLATIYPSVTNLIMKHLIYLPHHESLAEAYSEHKWEIYSTLVYPVEQSEGTRRQALERTLRLETIRRTNEGSKAGNGD